MGKTIATSTCEAEIHAAVVAVKDAIHIKKMLQDLELYPDDRPLEIAEDNSADSKSQKRLRLEKKTDFLGPNFNLIF